MERIRLVLLPSAVESRLKEGCVWRKWCDLVVLVVYADTLIPVDIEDFGGMSKDSVYEQAMVNTNLTMKEPVRKTQIGPVIGYGYDFGATAVVTDRTAQTLCGKSSSFILIPSSVHEFIIFEDTGEHCVALLLQTLRYANRNDSVVKPNEVLSDNLYYYDGDTGEFSILEVSDESI